ncbi:MAG: alpha-ribazole phosphatase family protein [Ferruginibacter sp.]|nr:alpha-ribazole phosphatase family protein [Ferruginibacter sp.]
MEIYLIRHTTPAIAKGVCYGQADLDVTESFLHEAAIIQQHLPASITSVYSSPLQRCKRLAEHLFTDHAIQWQDDLKEINCGKWELELWDEIPKDEIDPWLTDHVNVRIPGGESYSDVFERVTGCFKKIIKLHTTHDHKTIWPDAGDSLPRAVIVAHGGVIRSILSYITQTPLADSFTVFSFHYGCVIKIVHVNGNLTHEVLSNIAQEKETHKPSGI